jgi:processive 1,2-diacylglycerol beta-glucosyltransferase
VIVNPIPGQEERNSDHLLEGAVAIRCNNLPTMSYKLDRLLSDPERFKAMHSNSRQMGHPNAAKEIVEQLLTDGRPRSAAPTVVLDQAPPMK